MEAAGDVVSHSMNEQMDEDEPEPEESSSALQKQLMVLEASHTKLKQILLELRKERAAVEKEKDTVRREYGLLKMRYDSLMRNLDSDEGQGLRDIRGSGSSGGDVGVSSDGISVVSHVMAVVSKHQLLRSEFGCPM